MKPEEIKITNYLPHRYPFLLVDKVIDIKNGDSIHAVKNVTHMEPFFQGHFPGMPIMPGVLIIEAMAQASGLLSCFIAESEEICLGKYSFYLTHIDKAKFKRKVIPGDQLHLHATLKRRRKQLCVFETYAEVEGQHVCSAQLKVWFSNSEES